MPLPTAARRPRGERGSFTFAVVLWALMAMILAGLVVDGGLAISERQHAGDIAEQAARYAADDLNQDDLRIGQYVLKNDACANAVKVGDASGLPRGSVTCDPPGTIMVNGVALPTITVHVKISYSPILVGMVYSQPLTANAAATAHPQPGP
ncbi:MAG: TadE/TadG family type IV pilus assembly protein [Actinocrinis sp.]